MSWEGQRDGVDGQVGAEMVVVAVYERIGEVGVLDS